MTESSEMFYFQSGVFRQPRAIPRKDFPGPGGFMEVMYSQAAGFLDYYYPQHGYVNVRSRISLILLDDSGNPIDRLSETGQLRPGSCVLIAVTGPPESHPDLLVPHNVSIHSYLSPTFCDYCGEMLYGLIRQGFKCSGCGQNFHKRCADNVPNSCPLSKASSSGRTRRKLSSTGSSSDVLLPAIDSSENIGRTGNSPRGSLAAMAGFGRPQWIDRAVMEAESEGKIREHEFAIHNYLQPTVCSHCRKLLYGIFHQGFRCKICRLNSHKGCKKHMASVACVPYGSPSQTSLSALDLLAVQDGESNGMPSDEAPNIPLQRICVSIKRTAQKGTLDIIFAGWVVYRLKDDEREACLRYWILDARGVHIVDSDNKADRSDEQRCHTIPLRQITEIVFTANEEHIFEIVVSSEGVYCIGESVISFMKSSLSSYCKGEVPAEVLRPHALREGFTFKDILKQAVDEKRMTTFYNSLAAAHKPVDGNLIMPKDLAVDVTPAVEEPAADVNDNGKGATSTAVTESKKEEGSDEQSVGTSNSGASVQLDIPSQKSNAEIGVRFSTELETASIPEHEILHHRPSTEVSTMYQVFSDEVLGSGQFGIVLAGEHRGNGRKVAIKVVEKGSNSSSKQNAQLRNEAKILSSIEFPGIISLLNMFESENRILIVMERMDTDMLDMILNSPAGRLSERKGRFLIYQILTALQHLHRKSIAHCDLKPENCLLTGDPEFPQVKLCDFGFARVIGEKKFRRTIVGTPAYLAPEVLNNKGYNRSLDCWSVGVVIYVTLSGTFPFNEGEEITDQINSAEFLFPINPWGSVSAEAQHLIINLLTLIPRRRYTTAKSMDHKWFGSREVWDDLRTLEKSVGERYITHEAQEEHWGKGNDGDRLLSIDDSSDSPSIRSRELSDDDILSERSVQYTYENDVAVSTSMSIVINQDSEGEAV